MHREKSSGSILALGKYKQEKKSVLFRPEVGVQNDGSEAAFKFFTHLTAIGKFLINAYPITGFVEVRFKALSHKNPVFLEVLLKESKPCPTEPVFQRCR